MSSDEIREISRKIDDYKSKLSKLETLLSSDSRNSALLELKNDLIKVIQQNELLLASKKAELEDSASSQTATSKANATQPSAPLLDVNTQTNTQPLQQYSQGAAYAPVTGVRVPSFRPNSRVEAVTPSPYYPGQTTWWPATVETTYGELVRVRFIGLPGASNSVDLHYTYVKTLPLPFTAPLESELRPGLRVQCKWTGDGNWHLAHIREYISTDNIQVTFVGYDTIEVVPREYLQRAPYDAAQDAMNATAYNTAIQSKSGSIGTVGKDTTSTTSKSATQGSGEKKSSSTSSAAAAAAATGASDKGQGATAVNVQAAGKTSEGKKGTVPSESEDDDEKDSSIYQGLVIPDSLRLLPTDTEEQKQRKRRRVKALKLAWKNKVLEETSAAKQSSWQSFQSKIGVKSDRRPPAEPVKRQKI